MSIKIKLKYVNKLIAAALQCAEAPLVRESCADRAGGVPSLAGSGGRSRSRPVFLRLQGHGGTRTGNCHHTHPGLRSFGVTLSKKMRYIGIALSDCPSFFYENLMMTITLPFLYISSSSKYIVLDVTVVMMPNY